LLFGQRWFKPSFCWFKLIEWQDEVFASKSPTLAAAAAAADDDDDDDDDDVAASHQPSNHPWVSVISR